ncbi:hypothetical protein DXG01_015806 [Tephrocybe rancida]|nr:hypothetical protein DXG01_015806 [Tephrocybe rancida]
MHAGILTVKMNNAILERDRWPEACSNAALMARSFISTNDPSSHCIEQNSNYIWSWSLEDPIASSTRSPEVFLNDLGIAAYVAAVASDAAGEIKFRQPLNRFTAPPYSTLPCPARNRRSFQGTPDVLVLPSTAFVTRETFLQSERRQEYVEKASVLPILNRFPFLSKSTSLSSSSNDGARTWPETCSGHSSDTTHQPILKKSDSIHKKLESDQHIAPFELRHIIQEYDACRFLDSSRVCTAGILMPGETKQDDMVSTVVQCAVHIRHQQNAQPWLTFSLGLLMTEDGFGLLRADALGLEECSFSKETGRGVIETIRLALGIILATDQELGAHPGFTFREVETPSSALMPEKGSNPEPPKKRLKKLQSDPLVYRHREVNFITLAHNKLHLAPFDLRSDVLGKHTYYARYLLHQSSSIVGRRSRVWCVYKETDNPPNMHLTPVPDISTTSLVFSGPYALKFSCADVGLHTYKNDVISKISKAQVEHVLVPTHVWYLGKISSIIRGFAVGASSEITPDNLVMEREEVVTITALKRTLSQFSDMKDFVNGVIGALKDEEVYSEPPFLPSAARLANGTVLNITLLRREPVSIGGGGGLHDLDMAGCSDLIPTPPVIPIPSLLEKIQYLQQKLEASSAMDRSGQTPDPSLISSENIQKATTQSPYQEPHPLQSVFFVLYLAMYNFDGPAENCFPKKPPKAPLKIPEGWADTWDTRRSSMSSWRAMFFQLRPHDKWLATYSLCLPYWNNLKYFEILFAYFLSLWVEESHNPKWLLENISVDPDTIIRSLETILAR